MSATRKLGFILAAPLVLFGCNRQQQQAQPAQPAAYHVFVSNETSDNVSVIDGATNAIIATIPVGKRPRGLTASADHKTIYVTLSGSPIAGPDIDENALPPPDRSADGIAVIDVDTNTVTRVLKGIANPEQVAVTETGKLYSGSEDDEQVEVIDIASGAHVGSIPIPGAPEGVAVSPDGKYLYATSEEGEKVYVVDAATDAIVTSLPVGGRPRSVTFSPDGARAYVTGEVGKSLTAIDARRNMLLSTIHFTGDPMLPMGLVVSPDNQRVYVSTGRGGTVLVVDARSLALSATIPVGRRPWGVTLSPDGRFLYSANGTSNDVSVVNTETMQEIAKIETGNRPWGVLAVPVSGGSTPAQ